MFLQMPSHKKPKKQVFFIVFEHLNTQKQKNNMFLMVFVLGLSKTIAFHWFSIVFESRNAQNLKKQLFLGFLCYGIGKTLKTNASFGFNGFLDFLDVPMQPLTN